ncbi:hypothetical protein GP486_003736 [Trichoglossum hirsutum]|uniref:Uncharacterized protein n=1 Tax=Trichoglossum hirsutum TaxID=265104 RepID=A0A9P8LCK0_9PEZI|nr:hypothetical protein GP486_003736 [Trichoglossum hirsutum]
MPHSQSPPLILRIPRVDANDESFILLHVSQVGSSSSAPLDLELVATEGEHPQGQLAELRARNYKGEGKEWADILSTALLRKKREEGDAEAMKNLEVVASINEDNYLMITIRKDIGGIVQRLGTISMQQNEDVEIDPFQWAGIAAKSATTAEDEITSLSIRYRAQEEVIKKLSEQLEDLIKAKSEHENILLEKFVELLNAKKLKIRDQQRLLNGAKVDLGTGDSTAKPAAAASKSRKRKAATPESLGDDERDGSHGEPLDEVEDAETPETTDEEETEDEGSDNQLGFQRPEPQPRARGGATGFEGDGREVVTRQEKVSSPPPPRQLPFPGGRSLGKEQWAEAETNKRGDDNDDGDETGESDDDEL